MSVSHPERDPSQERRTVAFVGLGAMGTAMAGCLLRHGQLVRGFDVRPQPVQALAALGGQACRSSAEAADGADAAIVIVLNADQVEQAVFGRDGLAESLASGTPVVSMSTMSPGRAQALAARAAERGLRWLDAPVSGGIERARDGSLTTMVGGASDDLTRVRPMLEAFSRDIFHLGPVGSGSTAKMVNQVLVFCNLAAAAEAMTLCRKLGADQQAVYEVIKTAVGTSAVFETRVPKLIDGSYSTGGSLRIALKDLGILEDTAREVGMPMLMTAQATQLFRATAAGCWRATTWAWRG
ncbi:MAG: NAD(P)-dependent oxidoreductase [Chloroflexi bacterium]|nr:NAD(P)-dependent oxidoreductase [Chloroflexota bacterium]